MEIVYALILTVQLNAWLIHDHMHAVRVEGTQVTLEIKSGEWLDKQKEDVYRPKQTFTTKSRCEAFGKELKYKVENLKKSEWSGENFEGSGIMLPQIPVVTVDFSCAEREVRKSS